MVYKLRINHSIKLVFSLIIPSLFFFSGCLQTPPVNSVKIPDKLSKELYAIEEKSSVEYSKYYVKQGDTIWKISREFSVLPDTIISLNNIRDVTNLKTGQMLLIPGTQSNAIGIVFPPLKIKNQLSVSAQGFVWPIKNRVLTKFGVYKNGHKNTGIDLEGTENDDVVAAKDGEVIVVSNNSGGWGKVIVIKHNEGEHSWYAFNSKVFVKKGMRVKRGQVMAKAGQSGGAVMPGLHFKIFKDDKPVNPLFYLTN